MTVEVEGRFDRVENGRLFGWAWFPERPDEVADISVWVNGELHIQVKADQFRGDLKEGGKRGGHCGFVVPADDITGEIRLLASSTQTEVELEGGHFYLPARLIDRGSALSFDAGSLMIGGVDSVGPLTLSGWIQSLADLSEKPVLDLISDGQVILTFKADRWRKDLEELRQGDGRWGFDVSLPPVLRDGRPHRIELKLADGRMLLNGSIDITLPKLETGRQLSPPKAEIQTRRRRLSRLRPEISFVVNFYNMRREAERTLRSLTRDYQRGIGGLDYEVICVDNGSATPLDEAWVKGFGPEFRLVRPKYVLPSPCQALNAAAAQARGRHIAVMIDGAHVLTPGVMAEAVRHLRGQAPAVVALRHWFVGGDQRWLASAGYSRTSEDLLFDRIAWPTDGYELFRIGSPIGESPNSWFDGLSESNCLFMPTSLWRQIGGFDENFKVAGGGFANLDLLKRASARSKGGVTCLVGEATFHQYHGGTTTNVSDLVKDERVEAYTREYRALRGAAFEGLSPHEFRLSGRMQSEFATVVRQRPLYPAPLGVTNQIRPVTRRQVVDPGAERYLQGSYVELGLQDTTRWLGEPVGLAPTDVMAILDILREVRPTSIVTTSSDIHLLNFLDSACDILELGGTPIIQVGGLIGETWPARTVVVKSDPWARETLGEVERRVGSAEEILVLFEPPSAPGAPVAALADYASLVSYGSYIIYLGTARGQPWLGYSTQWPMKAIRTLTEHSDRYAVDHAFDQHFVTTCPSGYIRRIGGLVDLTSDDPELDILELL